MGRIAVDKALFRETVLNFYPSYVKKDILKRVINDGLVIDDKKKDSNQLTLNLNNSVDVSSFDTIDDKISHMMENEDVLAAIEDFEFRKPYRQFCFFRISGIPIEKINALVNGRDANVFDRKKPTAVDVCGTPTICSVGDLLYFKFIEKLTDDSGRNIKYVILAVLDKKEEILEIRFDRVGIAYKNSHTYYKDKVSQILQYFSEKLGLEVEHIDFKAIVEFIKSEKEDITIIAQKMYRNGATAYLEAYDGEEITIPILGELDLFINENVSLFDANDKTKEIKVKLQKFLKEIEVKSDMPMVKIRMAESGIRIGITHNYKDTEYSLFTLYGELVGEEMMSSVKEYLMRCDKELRAAVSADTIPTEKM